MRMLLASGFDSSCFRISSCIVLELAGGDCI